MSHSAHDAGESLPSHLAAREKQLAWRPALLACDRLAGIISRLKGAEAVTAPGTPGVAPCACKALHLAGDAIMTGTDAPAAPGKAV